MLGPKTAPAAADLACLVLASLFATDGTATGAIDPAAIGLTSTGENNLVSAAGTIGPAELASEAVATLAEERRDSEELADSMAVPRRKRTILERRCPSCPGLRAAC